MRDTPAQQPEGPAGVSRLGVIIVNWNAGTDLDRCLSALFTDERWAESLDVVLVDNASDDGSQVRAAREHPCLRLIQNPENVGFARAVNQGLRQTPGEFALLLNPDTVLRPAAIGQLVDFMLKRPDVAAVGPRLLNGDGSVQGSARRDPSAWTGLFGRSTLLTRWFPKNQLSRREILSSSLPSEEPLEVDWVSGACLLARAAAYRSVGLLDEGFFLFWEDADWCRRFRLAGWNVCFLPRAVAMHKGGVSWTQRPLRSLVHFHRSAYRYYRKHDLRAAWHPMILVLIAGLFLSLCLRSLESILQRTFPRKHWAASAARSTPAVSRTPTMSDSKAHELASTSARRPSPSP